MMRRRDDDPEQSRLLEPDHHPPQTTSLTYLFERAASTAQVRPYSESYNSNSEEFGSSVLPSSQEQDEEELLNGGRSFPCSRLCRFLLKVLSPHNVATTAVGACTFLLYHIVFCLAQAAAITRPHATHSTTGLMAQTAALGVIFAGPVFVTTIDIPAIYPASDLFLAPFLAKIAEEIDAVLWERQLHDDDRLFLATFGTVTGAAFALSGILCLLAARFKLANLGAFLPYSVLCGFFAAIGILMWTLGFTVDTGQKVGEVLRSGDWSGVIQPALIHHAPSFGIGLIMHVVGPSSPFLVLVMVLVTVGGSYGILWVTGITLQDATAAHWFYSVQDLRVVASPSSSHSTTLASTGLFGPPLPMGVWVSLWRGDVVWEAAHACVPTALALASIYLMRCSLHSAALRKNATNVTRTASRMDETSSSSMLLASKSQNPSSRRATKRTPVPSLGVVLERGYGYSQFAAALCGGITVAPSVAASLTMFKLGAEKPAPQYVSCLLVGAFYWTQFQIVQYIPKPAFSCLMVLAGLDMCRTWVVGSFLKTKSKLEWMVTPLIVVMAFAVGLLNAVFLGVALSTFIFAANFYRSGIVRFVGHGRTLRSTVERGVVERTWLDQRGDLIQILVLQHFLFFGNAQSVLSYVTTMFEETDADVSSSSSSSSSTFPSTTSPPVPEYLIIDFTMVSGMDTSAIDLFREILSLCKDHLCSLYLAGLNSELKAHLIFAGIKPDPGGDASFRFFADLESALAKAEDGLLWSEFRIEEKDELESSQRRRHRSESTVEDGFLYALRKIDEQHGVHAAEELRDFAPFTVPVELEPGDRLDCSFDGDGQGLYFVETGHLGIQPAFDKTTAGHRLAAIAGSDDPGGPTWTLGAMHARSGIAGTAAAIPSSASSLQPLSSSLPSSYQSTFRLARVGQGSVFGSLDGGLGGRQRPGGVHVAMTTCRLHHLPLEAVRAAERSNATLAMNLYKTVSCLATKREEATIQQLGQFVRIMTSPTPRLRGGKDDLVRLQNL